MPQKYPTRSFRLLAIRPLAGCSEKFLKILSENHIYRFYNSAKFLNQKGKKITGAGSVYAIEHFIKMPRGLFDADSADGQHFNISISAIAGKNGAGKSSVVELLFATIYCFSVNDEILEPNRASILKHSTDMEEEISIIRKNMEDLQATVPKILSDTSTLLKEVSSVQKAFAEVKNKFYNYQEKEEQLSKRLSYLESELIHNSQRLEDIDAFTSGLKVELYYHLDGVNYCLRIGGHEDATISLNVIPEHIEAHSKEEKLTKSTKKELLEHFFYTIAVNYSHYALNANVMGDWINSLFHKNDAYKTPVVINPMRIKGNFNINDETILTKNRFVANTLTEYHYSQSPVKVTDSQNVYRIRFTLNIPKIKRLRERLSTNIKQISGDERSSNMIIGLLARYFPGYELIDIFNINFPLKKELLDYIVNKVDRISELYPGFEDGYQFGPDAPMLLSDKFLDKIVADRTHVTFKLRQAINYIRKKTNGEQDNRFKFDDRTLDKMEKAFFEYSPKQLLEWASPENIADIISFLPPSIFKIEIILKDKKTLRTSSFGELSSGEQQLIHTLQSVIYHMNNIQSAHRGGEERIKYGAVNIIYDEIELYFHPEYQRRFIAELLRTLKQLHVKGKSRINSINILFLTHSPFILSDIPRENILLLEKDPQTGKSVAAANIGETFAANIHDLLANNFFLDGTLIGMFAELRIKALIKKIKRGKNRLDENDFKLIDMIGDTYLRFGFKKFIE
ncbi:hypothetical protein [Pedobacter mendelii]|nr:hypothetical protein [Pedobacter mendelii]